MRVLAVGDHDYIEAGEGADLFPVSPSGNTKVLADRGLSSHAYDA